MNIQQERRKAIVMGLMGFVIIGGLVILALIDCFSYGEGDCLPYWIFAGFFGYCGYGVMTIMFEHRKKQLAQGIITPVLADMPRDEPQTIPQIVGTAILIAILGAIVESCSESNQLFFGVFIFSPIAGLSLCLFWRGITNTIPFPEDS